MDAGHITIYNLENVAENGGMPKMQAKYVTEADFEEKTIGVTRHYASLGANEQIDLLVRIWRDTSIRIGMYAVLSESDFDGQYRITNVELTHENDSYRSYTNDDGLKTTDLTLQKVEENYDIEIG